MTLAKTSQNVTLFVFTIMVLATPSLLLAQTNSNSAKANPKDEIVQKSPDEPSLGALVSISRSRSLIDHENGTLKESADILLNPSAKFFGNSLSIKAAYSRDLHDASGSDWSDTSLALSREMKNWKNADQSSRSWVLSLLSSLPTSKVSSTKQSLLGAFGLGTSYSFLPANPNYGFTASIGFSLSKLLHQYDTAIDGSVNNSWASNQSLALGVQLGAISISGEFIHKARWTYQNSNKSSFEHTEELGYALNPNFQVALGHSNAGVAQKVTGENNIQLIDENESIIYSSLTMSY